MDERSAQCNISQVKSFVDYNNIILLYFIELQESNLLLKSKTKDLQDEVKRLEQDLITMHNKRVHDVSTHFYNVL